MYFKHCCLYFSHPEVLLSGDINIKVSLKGFPTPVTSALSVPIPLTSGRYEHYIFSGRKNSPEHILFTLILLCSEAFPLTSRTPSPALFFRVQISGDLPALARRDPSAGVMFQPILGPAAVATNSGNMAAQNPSPPRPANSIRVWLRCT